MRLNGWQRIWVVLTSIWFLYSYTFYEQRYDSLLYEELNTFFAEKPWAYHQLDIVSKNSDKLPEGFVYTPNELTDTFNTYDYEKIVKTIFEEFEVKKNESPYNKTFESLMELKNNTNQKFKESIYSEIGDNLMPPILLYLIGYSFGWIRKGFRK